MKLTVSNKRVIVVYILFATEGFIKSSSFITRWSLSSYAKSYEFRGEAVPSLLGNLVHPCHINSIGLMKFLGNPLTGISYAFFTNETLYSWEFIHSFSYKVESIVLFYLQKEFVLLEFCQFSANFHWSAHFFRLYKGALALHPLSSPTAATT